MRGPELSASGPLVSARSARGLSRWQATTLLALAVELYGCKTPATPTADGPPSSFSCQAACYQDAGATCAPHCYNDAGGRP